jgi:hypothetical protein
VKSLCAIYHGRIVYPTDEGEEPTSGSGTGAPTGSSTGSSSGRGAPPQ